MLSVSLHFYAFHSSIKSDVRRSRQGGHKLETKNIACDGQPLTFLFNVIIMTSHAYCLDVTYTYRLLAVPELTLKAPYSSKIDILLSKKGLID